ncbi:MAG: hypothetical protein IT350_14990 [Deltaproteobacteria bacterium]|nr:hypothetical protein [Deltaproteobacteria bacterium]
MPSLLALAKSLALIAPLAWAAHEFARRATRRASPVERATAAMVVFHALAVAGAGVLGFAGLLTYAALQATSISSACIALALRRFAPTQPTPDSNDSPTARGIPIGDAMLLATGVTAIAGAFFASMPHPAFDYDALTYHLHFPVQWLNAGRIFLIETPFGDAAPEYAPANGSLWFAWLMAPWREGSWPAARFAFAGFDALARFGQLPFAALLAASVALLAETLTGTRDHTARPAALAILMPWVVWQSATPGVDLIFSACLVAAIAFGARYALLRSSGSALLCGMSIGLVVGTKFVGLACLPIVLGAIVAWNGPRKPCAADIANFAVAALALGAPWYIRNWIVAGNPLFPAHVDIVGIEFFGGAYTRDAMARSIFHVPNVGAALVVAAHTFGYPLFFLAIACWVRTISAARSSQTWLVVVLAIPAAFIWHFIAVPYSSQNRFLIWVAALAFVPTAFSANTRRAVPFGLLVIAAVMAQSFWPETATTMWNTPVVFAGHFRVDSILALTAAWACFVAAIFAAPYSRMPQVSMIGARLVALAAGIVFIAVAGGAVRVPMSSLRELPLDAYARIWAENPECVAYAGRNRPLHLAGRNGRTRVTWIPVDGRDDLAFHDVVRAIGPNHDRDKAAWRYSSPDRVGWLAALRRSGARWLFIEPLGLEERAYLGYDEQGFPVERSWARERPDVFEPVLVSERYELYRVRGSS